MQGGAETSECNASNDADVKARDAKIIKYYLIMEEHLFFSMLTFDLTRCC